MIIFSVCSVFIFCEAIHLVKARLSCLFPFNGFSLSRVSHH